MSPKRYFFVFATLLLLLSGLVVMCNRVVDPFWYYRDIAIDGFNAIKPKFKNYERHVKPAIVQREQPASLVFGSSFAEVGFDPLHPALRAAGGSYNFGLAGAQWEMVECSVLFALGHDAALRQIVLGIHPQAMPLHDCQAAIGKMERPDERAFLFSYDALESSINTVLEQHNKKPSHTAEGLYFYTRALPGTASRFRAVFALHTPCEMRSLSVSGHAASATNQERAAPDFAGLRDIVRRAAAKGVKIKLVVYPHHALSLEQDYQCGVRQAKWDAMAQVVSLVEQESGGLAEVWDFEGYHEIGTESISDAPGKYWQDPTHFNYEFGNIMLDEMFAIKSPAFGTLLTTANLATRADSERKARAAYLDGHPEFLRQLESMLPNHAL